MFAFEWQCKQDALSPKRKVDDSKFNTRLMVCFSLNSTVPILKICCHSVAMVCNKTANHCLLFYYSVVCNFSGNVLKTIV